MMYGGLPPRARRAVKVALSASWLLGAFAGVSAVILSPVAIIEEVGIVGTLFSGGLLAATALTAAAGVITDRYRLEWVASWGAASALVPYLITVWALVLTEAAWRTTQAFLVTSLLAFFLSRGAICSAHAAKLRGAYTIETAAPSANRGRGGHAGTGPGGRG